jgi:cysteine-rich repeat protein
VKINSPRARRDVSSRVAIAIAACWFPFLACSGTSPSHAKPHQGAESDAAADDGGTADGAPAPRMDGGAESGSASTPDTGTSRPDQLVIFDLTGVVDSVSPITDTLPFPVAVGDPLRGVYAFNPSTATVATSDGVGSYGFDNVSGQFELHLDVGDLGVVSTKLDPSLMQSTISVGDDVQSPDGGLTDSYDIEVKQATASGFFGQAIDFSLRLAATKDLGTVRSMSLPLEPPDVSRFDDASFTMHLAGAEVRGHATAVTRSTSTVSEGVCGDGILNYGEECDDFNDRDGDGCDSCRFSCIAGDPDRACDTGDACNAPATCLASAHTCVPGPERPNFTVCSKGRACWEGVCQNVDAEPSRFATFTFKAYVDQIEATSITVPPPDILYADTINGAFTVDVTAPAATESKTKREFDYAIESGGFAFYATVGPLHLVASKGDANATGGSMTIRSGEYDVAVGQLVAVGSPVAPATIAITVASPDATLSLSSPLTLASTPFAGGKVVLTYGGLVLHANLSSIRRAAGGTAPSPVPDGGNGNDAGPPPSLDSGIIIGPGPSKDAGTGLPMPASDAGIATTP